MSDELDDFTAQLNSNEGGATSGAGAPSTQVAQGGPPPGAQKYSPEQMAAIKAAKEMEAKIQAKPLKSDVLKGKLDMKWFGHAGFKLSFMDKEDIQRAVYIDIWIDNKDCPEEEKKECPNDADLVCVSHGQLDHSMHAPFLIMAGKKDDRKIVCTSEVGTYYELFRKIPGTFIAKMQKGGTKDFGYCKVTMVHADHPSTCVGPQGVQITGGDACGFIVEIPHLDFRLYHCGDTNIFSDMKLIDELYQPNVVCIPIGDCLGMGPREAAYCVKNFLPTPKVVVPMHFNSFPVLTGTPDEFIKQCELMGVTGKEIKHPEKFVGGQPLIDADE